MEKLVAYATRDDEAIAGSVSVGDGEAFDIGAALEEGEGTITVVAGSLLERSLDGVPALERVTVPEGAEAVNAEEAEGTAPDATDAAVRKAAELDVDLAEVTGTGADGAIKVTDVEEFAAARDAESTDDSEDEGDE
jgi:pyruvate/2-oxoglutarate dehydrogenase complex dihydrolipoamide acyltransferase (E2) component